MRLLVDRPIAGEANEVEALIRQAHRLRRRRWLIGVSIVVAGAVGGTGYSVFATTTSLPPSSKSRPKQAEIGAKTVVGGLVRHPYGLAVAPNGDLYVVDAGRDQILRRLPSGRFELVAGDGKRGFSGDGGRAVKAELNLGWSSGIVAMASGSILVADTSNKRVREIRPDGIIDTFAGNGRAPFVAKDRFGPSPSRSGPAIDASIGPVTGLAVSTRGDVYIAGAQLYRVSPAGTLGWVAGDGDVHRSSCGSRCTAASENQFLYLDQMAFDGAGDLFVSDFAFCGLEEITKTNRLVNLGPFRGDGGPPALASDPNGHVVVAARNGFYRLTPNRRPVPLYSDDVGVSIDALLGRMNGGPNENSFIGGDGVAVAPSGDVYADTNTGNTFTSVSAIVEVTPAGKAIAVWKS